MPVPVACTIVANNYLAYARVFARSFLEHHPNGRVYVLVVDLPHPGVNYQIEPFETIWISELGIPMFEHFAFGYSILELSTAVKPRLLLELHRRFGIEQICYFDPDILVLAPLDHLYQRLDSVDAILTPHITKPIEDRLIPGERDFLLSGIYNLGFVGFAFNERTLAFLDWWDRHLYRECLHAVERGLFVDQRWMDFAPAFLDPIAIERDPAYNVAYWNLMQRPLERRADQWWVGDRPLRFFHFSGYDYTRPDAVSKYQNRITLEATPQLQPLLAEYQQRLTAAGHKAGSLLPWAFDWFEDGTPIPPAARRALRSVDPHGRRWPNPVATQEAGSFLEWLREPADRNQWPPLSRIALALWDQRPDLQQAFPSPGGRDRARFAHWLSEHREEAGGEPFLADTLRALHLGRQSTTAELQEMQRRVWDDLARHQPLDTDSLSSDDIASLTSEASPDGSGQPRISRLALILYRQRPDVQQAFADPFGSGRHGFAMWFITNGRREYSLPDALVLPVLRSLPLRQRWWARAWWWRQQLRRRRHAWSHRRAGTGRGRAATARPRGTVAVSGVGANVVGWAAAPTGVGEACRASLDALATAGIPHALWSLGRSAADDCRGGNAAGIGGDGLPFEVTLFHVNADMMETVTNQLPRALLAGRYRIGYWFWELAYFPLAFAPAFRCVDEVWAPSRFCAESFRALASVPVRLVPPAVIPPRARAAERSQLGIPSDRFLFFNSFDALSIPDRKNPLGLIEAFAAAVVRSTRPLHLLIKSTHLESGSALDRTLRRSMRGLPVTLIARELPREEVNGLTAACDAYLSLHRSEGLGLPLIEAAFLGKPLVATGYGGVTDFLDGDTGWVVGHALAQLEEPRGPYPAGSIWAEPDLDDAVEKMLAVADREPGEGDLKVERASQRVRELYSPEAAGNRFRTELQRIYKQLGAPQAGDERPAASSPAPAASCALPAALAVETAGD